MFGQRQRFEALLEHLTRDPRFAAAAVPRLVEYQVDDGQVARAVATLRGVFEHVSKPEDDSVLATNDRIDLSARVLVGGVEALAAGGYLHEGIALLDSAPERIREDEKIRDLRLRLDAGDGDGVGQPFADALASLGASNPEMQQKLKIAELAATAGDAATARKIAEPALSAADPDVAARALDVLLVAGRATGDDDAIDGWVTTYLDKSSDRVGARHTAITVLTRLGYDERALKIAREQARRMPPPDDVRRLAETAQRAGDADALEAAEERFARVADHPLQTLEPYAQLWPTRQRDAMSAKLFDTIRSAHPARLQPRMLEALHAYQVGRPEHGRELLDAYLDEVDWDPQAVSYVFDSLDQFHYYGVLARYFGPRVPKKSR